MNTPALILLDLAQEIQRLPDVLKVDQDMDCGPHPFLRVVFTRHKPDFPAVSQVERMCHEAGLTQTDSNWHIVEGWGLLLVRTYELIEILLPN